MNEKAAPSDEVAAPALRMRSIGKRFGSTVALDQVSLDVHNGEVHAVIGENGAGKSTLMKVLSGAVTPDTGEIILDGNPVRFGSTRDALRAGISMIYQELTLAPHLSVADNLMLGREQHACGWIRHPTQDLKAVLARLGLDHIDLTTRASVLGVGERHIIEIARALLFSSRIVIMDEPTSSLTARESEKLFDAVRALKSKGVAIIYISHFLEEIKALADTFTVLRDGKKAGAGPIRGTELSKIIGMMIGRPIGDLFPSAQYTAGEKALRVQGLSRGNKVRDVSFEVRFGEIFGIAGLVGSGRTELLRCLFGLDHADRGSIIAGGKPMVRLSPGVSIQNGIAFISEDRKDDGLALNLSIRHNTTLPALRFFARMKGMIVHGSRERSLVRSHIKELAIKCHDDNQRVLELSGGNQQKVLCARMLASRGSIIILDEPTRGVDIGSKSVIYSLIGRLAGEGKAIVIVSSYLPELLGICTTLAVMHRGRLSPVRPRTAWTEESIMTFATTGVFRE